MVAVFGRTRRVAIPVIVLGEYRFGIAKSRHRDEYERWLQQMISACGVFDVDDETATCYARLRAQLRDGGTRIPQQ